MVQAAADGKQAVADNDVRIAAVETADNDHDHGIKQSETRSGLLVARLVLCGIFMACSSMLIILNKVLIVDLNFHFPMIVTSMGMAVSALSSYTYCNVLGFVPSKVAITWKDFGSKIAPVGFFMAVTMHTGNEAYLHLSLSFIQMMKAVTPIITMLALFLAKLENPNTSLIYSVLVICFGTAMAVYGEVNLSATGMVFMATSEVAEAMRLVLTQYLLVGMQMHPMESLMYLAPACLVWLSAGSAIREWPVMMRQGGLLIVVRHWGKFLAAAVMGFGVNVMGYMVIKQMGSVTLKVLAIVRNVAIVAVGVLLMGNIVTYLQAIGYAISMAGFAWYNYCLLMK